MTQSYEKSKCIETEIGFFDISMPPDEFSCRENPGIICDRENNRIIKSCLTKLVFTMDNGAKEVIEPIVLASCMNPDVINIIPITYTEKDGSISVSTPYQAVDITDGGIKNVRTEAFWPVLKKHSCIPCRNCGRC